MLGVRDSPRMGLCETQSCLLLGDTSDSLSANSQAVQNGIQKSAEERERKVVYGVGVKAEQAQDYPLIFVLPCGSMVGEFRPCRRTRNIG